MNNEIKQTIIEEIEKYNQDKSLILKTTLNDITLYELINNEILSNKILTNNEYGNIANLLYNYKNYLDTDILINLCKKDYQNNRNRFGGMLYLLETDEKISNQLLSNENNVIQLINIFDYIIIDYLNDNLKNNKEFILSIIDNNHSDKKTSINILSYLTDNMKNDIDIVYKVLSINNYLEDKIENYNNVKEIYQKALSKFTMEDNCELDLSILPDELKKDSELVKIILEKVYKYIPQKEQYTIKELHLEYANHLKEQLNDTGSIYGRPLCYSDDLPQELLNDKEFIKSIIEVDDEYDQAFLRKQYNLGQKPKVKINPEYQRYFIMSQDLRFKGKTYMKNYEFEKAIIEFEKGIERYPYYHGCYLDKAECLIRLGRIDDAITFLNDIYNSEELKKADKIYYSSCSNDAVYPKYTCNFFFKVINNGLLEAKRKKERGYVYRPRKKHD